MIPWYNNSVGQLIRPKQTHRCHSNLVRGSSENTSVFGLSLLLANTMSMAPKIDEIRYVVSDVKPDLGIITETWLQDSSSANDLHISNYHFLARNRNNGMLHGGVGIYVKNNIRFKSLPRLYTDVFEALWVWLRSLRLPRGIPCVIAGSFYHPQFIDDAAMLEYLSSSLTTIKGLYPGWLRYMIKTLSIFYLRLDYRITML